MILNYHFKLALNKNYSFRSKILDQISLTFEFIAVFSNSASSLWTLSLDMFRHRVEVTVVAEAPRVCSKGPFKFASTNHLSVQPFPSVQFAVHVVEDDYGEFA